ncbi:GNAT family N-acetyltransferase [Subtercola boreus]|uniref:GNAT family N-acetyltransferase n=1 Tax=Subtercola boreus TaxID=120213 RepID=A0A3E0W6V7_9MICO|nr:GNAT family N-acetyltransferase [Subtercola boreus]RFA18274.1 GNAT family N-acetyltransferase [Subtercola boreus]RFA18666.1 GNAT family N-acetyltransferase [Subtercola boreus]RFA25269.1 GNAT family N-acetyltransferase [Subtercola boreus]
MAREILHDTDRHRYLLRIDGALVSAADYVESDTSISFTHTFTDPKLRGQGYANEVVTFAVDDVEQNTALRIVPMCQYVGQWFDEHPERSALLER